MIHEIDETQIEELIEARAIVTALAAIREQLNSADVRFLDSWESYLKNAPAPAIGKWRMHNLRTVAATFDILLSATVARVEKMDATA